MTVISYDLGKAWLRAAQEKEFPSVVVGLIGALASTMTPAGEIEINDELAGGCLRAAVAANDTPAMNGLFDAGVDPNDCFGAALVVAKRYHSYEAENLLKNVMTDRNELLRRGRLKQRIQILRAASPNND